MRADTSDREVCKRPGCGKLVWIGSDRSGDPYSFCGITCSTQYASVESNLTATEWDFIAAASYSPSTSRRYATPEMEDYFESRRNSTLAPLVTIDSSRSSRHMSLQSTSPDTPDTSDSQIDDSSDVQSIEIQLCIRLDDKMTALPSLSRTKISFKQR